MAAASTTESCMNTGCKRSPSKSSVSTAATESPTQDCIIFDFDDTLFPTSHILEHCGEAMQLLYKEVECPGTVDVADLHELSSSFLACEEAACAVLAEAAKRGKVRIVTMAERGWVDACCRLVMPTLGAELARLGIKVVCAREAVRRDDARRAFNDGMDMSQLCKQKAMRKTLRRSRGPRWGSVLSIGDSEAERRALQETLFVHDVASAECKCKTVKLLDEPALETLVAELQILGSWLETLVERDVDMDISFSELVNQGF